LQKKEEKETRNRKKEELRTKEGDDESMRCSIYWMIELKRH
jgi:hypothetical protein